MMRAFVGTTRRRTIPVHFTEVSYRRSLTTPSFDCSIHFVRKSSPYIFMKLAINVL